MTNLTIIYPDVDSLVAAYDYTRTRTILLSARKGERWARIWPSSSTLLVSSLGRLWVYMRRHKDNTIPQFRTPYTAMYPEYFEETPRHTPLHPMWTLQGLLSPGPRLYFADSLVAFAFLSIPTPDGLFDIVHHDGDPNNLDPANLAYSASEEDSPRVLSLRTLYDARQTVSVTPDPDNPALPWINWPDDLSTLTRAAQRYILRIWQQTEELPAADEIATATGLPRPHCILELISARFNLIRFDTPYPYALNELAEPDEE